MYSTWNNTSFPFYLQNRILLERLNRKGKGKGVVSLTVNLNTIVYEIKEKFGSKEDSSCMTNAVTVSHYFLKPQRSAPPAPSLSLPIFFIQLNS